MLLSIFYDTVSSGVHLFLYAVKHLLCGFSAFLTLPLSYIIEGHVCYLTMCDRSYPKKLAFQYLEDLRNEFERVNGSQIETAARPYAFIKFGEILVPLEIFKY